MMKHSMIGLALVTCIASVAPASAQQATDNARTVVAAVRLENGFRASKVIGASVYNAQNEQVGTVSDLFLNRQNQVAMAVIAVGGVVGIGSKLVAVPFDKLQIDDKDKVVMADGNKDALSRMPDVKYSD